MMSGERLKALRIGKGWTQDKLSEKSGVSQGHISDLEHGRHLMDVPTAQRLAKALRRKWTIFFADE